MTSQLMAKKGSEIEIQVGHFLGSLSAFCTIVLKTEIEGRF